jgi:adenosylcobyric acid synthase
VTEAEAILVAGTASHVGKSTVAAGLCRYLDRRGVSVAPFKAQNMSNNARVAVTPDGDWGEIGVSQYAQARAANATPTTDVNPVLLKPSGGGESQLVIHGEAIGRFEAGEYYEEHWDRARGAAVESYERLAATHDVVVAEGAGSVAEINLHDRDLANVETARFADASILLLGDVERGGVFASLYGTLELMPADLRERVRGLVVTKFRGDASLLEPGCEIHAGRTRATAPVDRPLGEGSAANGDALGTYLHGLFENESVRDAFLDSVFRRADARPPPGSESRSSPYDDAARLVEAIDPASVLEL